MFGQLKSIVDILRSGLSYLDKRKKEDQHVELVLRLLETYFILKDCADEGEALLKEAGPDPAEILRALDAWKAHSTLKKWDAMVRRQGIRLRMLLGYISGQESLSIVDPDLQERIKTVIGSKMSDTVTLSRIGASLFFREIFPEPNKLNETPIFVSLIAGTDSDVLDLDKAKAEIGDLRESLVQYRGVVERLVSNDEILKLSHEARRKTLLKT